MVIWSLFRDYLCIRKGMDAVLWHTRVLQKLPGVEKGPVDLGKMV